MHLGARIDRDNTAPNTTGMVHLGLYCEDEVDAFWNPSNGGVFFIDRETGFLLGNTVFFKDTVEEAKAYAEHRLAPREIVEISMW